MPSRELVRTCPFCFSHPPYAEPALQCAPCGAIRPWRAWTASWIRCEGLARQLAADALDRVFHSDDPLRRVLQVEISLANSGEYALLGAAITSSGSQELAAPKETARAVLEEAGLKVSS